MRRRAFIALAAAMTAMGWHAAHAQPIDKMMHIAVIAPPATAISPVFRNALRDAGFVDGSNLAIDWRFEARPEALADLARDVLTTNPRLVVGVGNPPVIALMKATRTVPIVMFSVADPVGNGYVASLARPGANVTGVSNGDPDLNPKRLELLTELQPGLRRVAVLRNAVTPSHRLYVEALRPAADARGIAIVAVDHFGPERFEESFQIMAREHAEAVIMLPDNVTGSYKQQIVALAARYRMPAIYALSAWTEAGGLISYYANIDDMWRRTAGYVDKILKGAKPSDLPVEQPSKFELVVNLKTAKALGATVPLSILNRADEVIE